MPDQTVSLKSMQTDRAASHIFSHHAYAKIPPPVRSKRLGTPHVRSFAWPCTSHTMPHLLKATARLHLYWSGRVLPARLPSEEWNQALKVILYILIVAAGMALAYFLKTDYAEKGVFCIMVLYIFRKKKMWQIIAGCASFIWETPALFGFIPIAFYNGTRGWKMKYFFYIFYPAHLLILYLLCYFMGISGYSAV